jgi:formamidopyrimidine-DNA glycosylase
MPELPEVRAHAERLTAESSGAIVDRFEPLSFTALKTADPPIGDAAGRAIESIRSRGKLLVIRLEPSPDGAPEQRRRSFVIHLMQGGRLTWDAKNRVHPRGGQARWHLRDGRSLLLTESGTEHRVGVWFVAGDPERSAPLTSLGPDADTVDVEELAERLTLRSMRLHNFLRDQHGIAGLGRRLADEVCHGARLSPFALTTKLRPDDVDRLVTTIRDQVAADVAFERTRHDMSHAKDRVGSVHRRVGDACPVCGDRVRSVTYRDHSVAYCPTCQTRGRLLADNTTSKFLR